MIKYYTYVFYDGGSNIYNAWVSEDFYRTRLLVRDALKEEIAIKIYIDVAIKSRSINSILEL